MNSVNTPRADVRESGPLTNPPRQKIRGKIGIVPRGRLIGTFHRIHCSMRHIALQRRWKAMLRQLRI